MTTGFSLKVCKYLLDHRRVFDTGESLPREHSERFGYYLDSATACFTSRNINVENPFQSLCPDHRGVTFCGCAVICFTVSLALVALAAFCRCYQGTKLAIWTVRRPGEHAMDPGQVNSGLRHQGGFVNKTN